MFSKLQDLIEYFKKNKQTPSLLDYSVNENSFFDVHQQYDKNDFIFLWKELLDSNIELWQKAKNEAKGKKILVATLGGGFSHRPIMSIDNIISIALTLRGAQVETFFCDHALPVCLKAEYAYIKPEIIHHSQISETLCKGCYTDNFSTSLQLGLTNHRMSRFVTLNERQTARKISQEITIPEIKNYQIDNLSIGKHAIAGAIRYFSHSDPTQVPLGNEIIRRFLEASIISYYAVTRLFKENKYESVFLTQGSYLPHGIIKEICEQRGIPLICWAVSYMKNRFIFTEGETILAMLYEPNEMWENMQWGKKNKRKI